MSEVEKGTLDGVLMVIKWNTDLLTSGTTVVQMLRSVHHWVKIGDELDALEKKKRDLEDRLLYRQGFLDGLAAAKQARKEGK